MGWKNIVTAPSSEERAHERGGRDEVAAEGRGAGERTLVVALVLLGQVAATRNSKSPTWSTSPSCRGASATRSRFRNVPLRLPRSRTLRARPSV